MLEAKLLILLLHSLLICLKSEILPPAQPEQPQQAEKPEQPKPSLASVPLVTPAATTPATYDSG